MLDMDDVVTHCPLRGHGPLCSSAECYEESKNNYEQCMIDLGIKSQKKCHTCRHVGIKDFVCGYCKNIKESGKNAVQPDDVCDYWDESVS